MRSDLVLCLTSRYESDPKLERMRKEEIRADDPMVRVVLMCVAQPRPPWL